MISKAGNPALPLCMALIICLAGVFSVGSFQRVSADESGAEEETEYVCQIVTSEEEAARWLWIACRGYGMPNQNIAAILGCLSVVSSMDPGAMEFVSTRFDQENADWFEAADDPRLYTSFKVASYYQAIDSGYTGLGEEYLADDGSYYMGLGIGLWRGNKGKDFLKQADFLMDGKWNTIDYNIVYLLQEAAPDGNERYGKMLCQWKSGDLSVEDSVKLVATHWLGYPDGTDLSLETEKALQYKEMIATWTYDDLYAQGIKILVNRLDHHRVIDTFHYDNSTPALAAVSISHQHMWDGYWDNGIELYRTVRDNVDDPWVVYKSCDRLIGAAYRWSGADIEFPMGNVNSQFHYVRNSDQWELIAVGGDISRDNLEPGDIFICLGNVGHIWMYVGQDAIRAIYGNDFSPEDADSVSAGYAKWSPMVGNYFYIHCEASRGYQENIDRATGTYFNPPQFVPYYQFRLVYSDESDLYKDAADGDPLRWPR